MPARRSHLVSPALGDQLTASLAALRESLSLPDAFPDAVLAEAAHAAATVSVDPRTAGLDDLRALEFLTIDPAGSMDLDQAMHIERTADGAILHYAIADVPAFVTPGGEVDAEARRRGQTLYLADDRIPLHPPVLSEDAASLVPGADRRAFVWRFVLDRGARPVETSLGGLQINQQLHRVPGPSPFVVEGRRATRFTDPGELVAAVGMEDAVDQFGLGPGRQVWILLQPFNGERGSQGCIAVRSHQLVKLVDMLAPAAKLGADEEANGSLPSPARPKIGLQPVSKPGQPRVFLNS